MADPINFNGVPWSAGYAAVLEERKRLPIYPEREKFLEAVIIVDSPCGSGTSTQIPQFVAHALHEAGITLNVMMTQPEGLAGRNVASRIARELDSHVGELVLSDVTKQVNMPAVSQNVRIVVTTADLLFERMMSDRSLPQTGVIIIDEVHDRAPKIEVVLGLLHMLLKTRSDLKVICMSASADNDNLMRHFGPYNPVLLQLGHSPHPVDVTYTPAPLRDWMAGATDKVREIMANPNVDPGDVLIFCLDGNEMVQLKRKLVTMRQDTECDFIIVPLCPEHNDEEEYENQEQALKDHTDGTAEKRRFRRVILCTEYIESSLTIPSVNHGIDSGLRRLSAYDARTDITVIRIVRSARSQLKQRLGRVGRVRPGTFHFLFPEAYLGGEPL